MSRFRKHTRPEYRWCVRELDTANNFRRVAAEIDILDTAHDDRDDREEVFWGGRRVTLQNTDGLMIAYHMRDGDEVSFDIVFGTDPLPDWFVNRTGTWFETLDLT
ncbi:MAG: hypothetical protein ABI553_06425 [Chloroflexota bacterium]